MINISYRYIINSNELLSIESFTRNNNIKRIYIDTETTGLNAFEAKLCVLQILVGSRVFVINVGMIGTDADYDCISALFEDDKIVKIGHHLKFDLKFLTVQLFGETFSPKNLFDTCIAEKLLTSGISEKGDHKLAALVKKYMNQILPKDQQTTFEFGKDLTPDQMKYAINDTAVLPEIFEKQKVLLQQQGLVDTALLEFTIIPAVVRIELAGMYLDQVTLSTLSNQLEEERSAIEASLNGMLNGTKVNFSSPEQVKKLFKSIGIAIESTDIKTLSKINHPVAKEIVKFREVNKLVTSFAKKLPDHVSKITNRVHPELNQLGAETGRFTCSNPNLQQMPHDQVWRDLFIAMPGNKIITADYSQIELRILAEFSQDPVFLEAFRKGRDLHQQTASQIFNISLDAVTKDQRSTAKTINFGLVYGMGSGGLSAKLNIPVVQAEDFINRYFRAYPTIKKCLDHLGMAAVRNGYSQTPLGRKRYYKPAYSFGERKSRERQGRNAPIQATCADILKTAMLLLYPLLPEYGGKMINLVHDEIVFEVKAENAEALKSVIEVKMVEAGTRFIKSLPVEVEITIADKWQK